jgi:hypothetical protein
MNSRRVILILLVQCALVGFLGAKYLYDRHAYPRVWTTATLYDPDLLFRGRYLALQLNADGCQLPETHATSYAYAPPSATPRPDARPNTAYYDWTVRLHAVNGKLIATDAEKLLPNSLNQRASRTSKDPCTQTRVGSISYFIPDTFKLDSVMKKGDTLWVEVTVPPVGTPRPIQLAVVHDGVFTPLKIP